MNGFLLDTNILSEIVRRLPEKRVLNWLDAVPDEESFLSAISLGEMRKGASLLANGRQRQRLEEWLEREVLPGFEERILPVTRDIADRWGSLSAMCRLRGTPLAMADGLIAATGLHHGLALVTRNERDFYNLGLTIINPWN